jgi:hypothetical protein
MMIKNLSQLEHKIGERVYHFSASMDSPINEVKDALFQFMKYVGKIEDAAREQSQPAHVEQPEPVEPAKE